MNRKTARTARGRLCPHCGHQTVPTSWSNGIWVVRDHGRSRERVASLRDRRLLPLIGRLGQYAPEVASAIVAAHEECKERTLRRGHDGIPTWMAPSAYDLALAALRALAKAWEERGQP